MQFINYFFSSILSFSGLLIGLILISLAPEEQKPLEKHFALMKRILLPLMFAFLMLYYFNNWLYFTVLSAFLMFLMLIEFKTKDLPKKTAVTYAVFGALFYLSSKNINLFAIESSLILLYGVPTMSLAYNKKEKNRYKAIFKNIWFILISNLLFFITIFHF